MTLSKEIKNYKQSASPRLSLAQALEVLKKGGVVAYPTETFYGLGVVADDVYALEKIFEIKERDRGKPVSILIADRAQLESWVDNVSPRDEKLITAFWPGALTLVFKARSSVSNLLTAGSGKLGVRISPNPIALGLCKGLGRAITATSANLSGESSCRTAEEVAAQLGSRIDGIVEGVTSPTSKGSTILDVSGEEIKVIREGDVLLKRIEEHLKSN